MSLNLKESLAMQDRAKLRIPGMTQLLSKRPDMFSQGVWPGYYSKAKGAEVWDLDGNKYIDMSIGGIGATVLGYADDDVDNAVIESIRSGVASSLNCPEEVELAELLCELHPWADMARFTRAGGEAMAMAVRIARAHTGKDKVAFCGYHGWHDWYLAANLSSDSALDGHLLPGLEPTGVPAALADTAFTFPYNDLDALKKLVSNQGTELGAIVMESRRSVTPDPVFLEGVRDIADSIGAVLVVDEISAGFRLNSGGAHLTMPLQPDIAVFSKAMGNGYPIAAVIGKEPVMASTQKSFISSTCWTDRSGPTAAIAMIKKFIKYDVSNHLVNTGNQVMSGWKQLAEKHGFDITVSGMPPMGHFVINSDDAPYAKAFFIQSMLERGFLASNLCYIMHSHTSNYVEQYLSTVDEVFAEIMTARNNGSLKTQLLGKPSVQGFKRLTD